MILLCPFSKDSSSTAAPSSLGLTSKDGNLGMSWTPATVWGERNLALGAQPTLGDMEENGSLPPRYLRNQPGSLEQCLSDIEQTIGIEAEQQVIIAKKPLSDPLDAWEDEAAELYSSSTEEMPSQASAPRSENERRKSGGSSSSWHVNPPMKDSSALSTFSADSIQTLKGIDVRPAESRGGASSQPRGLQSVSNASNNQNSMPDLSRTLPSSDDSSKQRTLSPPIAAVDKTQLDPANYRKHQKSHSICLTSDTTLVPGSRLKTAQARRRSTKGNTLDHDAIMGMLEARKTDDTKNDEPVRRTSIRRPSRLFSIISKIESPDPAMEPTRSQESEKSEHAMVLESLKRFAYATMKVKKGSDEDHAATNQDKTSGSEFKVLEAWLQGKVSAFRKKSNAMTILDFEELDHREYIPLKVFGITLHMVSPTSMFYLVWNLFGLVMISYDCCVIPMDFFDPEFPFEHVMEWLMRIYWTLNMFCSFTTGFMRSDGTVEMQPRAIAQNYLMTWFSLDVFVVGMDWAEYLALQSMSGLHRYGILLRVVRMIRTVRLFRIIKAPHMTKL